MLVVRMVAWLKRSWPLWLLDAQVALALAVPGACSYLRWVMLGLYAGLSLHLFKQLHSNLWILDIVRDARTRIAHGLEHATMTVLQEEGLPVRSGFTHGPDRFAIVLDAGHGDPLASIRQAATRAVDRIRHGERSLAYHPGCGTSEVVAAVTLWVVGMSSILSSLALGASVEICFALGVIAFRIWIASVTSLGLIAQRLFTVSTAFSAARVVAVRPMVTGRGVLRPQDKAFEVVVDVSPAASDGGVVAPGALFV